MKRWGKGRVRRLVGTGAGLIFKGSGFYSTDYRSENYKAAAKKESTAATGGESKGDAKKASATPSGSDAKPSAKADSAAASKPAKGRPGDQ